MTTGESERSSVAGFGDGGGGPWAKACEWPLGAGKGKEAHSLLETQGRNTILSTP